VAEGRRGNERLILTRGSKEVAPVNLSYADEMARRTGEAAAGVVDAAMVAMLDKRHRKARTPLVQLVWREIVLYANQRYQQKPCSVPVLWSIDGGKDAFARKVGYTMSGAGALILEALDIICSTDVPLVGDRDTGIARMVTYEDIPARGRKQSRLDLYIYKALIADCAGDLHFAECLPRFIVPVPQELPGRVIHRRFRGEELLWQQATMLLLADRSRAAVEAGGEAGGWEITDRDWRDISDTVELPWVQGQKIAASYIAPDGGLWSVLVRQPSGLYLLSPAYKAEQAMLLQQGRYRISQAKVGTRGGKKTAARKKQKRKAPDPKD